MYTPWLQLTGSIIVKKTPKNSYVKTFKRSKISDFEEKRKKKNQTIRCQKFQTSKKKKNKELDDSEQIINIYIYM